MIVLCDVDHCVSDARWRDHLLGDWPAYHGCQMEDRPVRSIIRMVNAMSLMGDKVVHLTARPEIYRRNTLDWMLLHGVMTDGLIMRPHEDHTPSAELKIRLAMEHYGDMLVPVGLVIDDREDVLDRFRAVGVETIQVGLGGVRDERV